MQNLATLLTRHFGAAAFLVAAILWLPLSAASGQTADKSLFERLGGKAAITAVVAEFTARQLADDRLNKYYQHTDKAAWRGHLVDLICNAAGGPCTYTGRAMNVAHGRQYISDDQFNWTAEHLVGALNHFKVPKQEQDELVAIVVSLKGQVVGQ